MNTHCSFINSLNVFRCQFLHIQIMYVNVDTDIKYLWYTALFNNDKQS